MLRIADGRRGPPPPGARPSPRPGRPPLRVGGRHRGGGMAVWGWPRARRRRRRPRTPAVSTPDGGGWMGVDRRVAAAATAALTCGYRHGCRHGAVSFVPMMRNGGRTSSPGHPTAALFTATPLLSVEQGAWMETAEGRQRGTWEPTSPDDATAEATALVEVADGDLPGVAEATRRQNR